MLGLDLAVPRGQLPRSFFLLSLFLVPDLEIPMDIMWTLCPWSFLSHVLESKPESQNQASGPRVAESVTGVAFPSAEQWGVHPCQGAQNVSGNCWCFAFPDPEFWLNLEIAKSFLKKLPFSFPFSLSWTVNLPELTVAQPPGCFSVTSWPTVLCASPPFLLVTAHSYISKPWCLPVWSIDCFPHYYCSRIQCLCSYHFLGFRRLHSLGSVSQPLLVPCLQLHHTSCSWEGFLMQIPLTHLRTFAVALLFSVPALSHNLLVLKFRPYHPLVPVTLSHHPIFFLPVHITIWNHLEVKSTCVLLILPCVNVDSVVSSTFLCLAHLSTPAPSTARAQSIFSVSINAMKIWVQVFVAKVSQI